jgi:hypothetical protein
MTESVENHLDGGFQVLSGIDAASFSIFLCRTMITNMAMVLASNEQKTAHSINC